MILIAMSGFIRNVFIHCFIHRGQQERACTLYLHLKEFIWCTLSTQALQTNRALSSHKMQAINTTPLCLALLCGLQNVQ